MTSEELERYGRHLVLPEVGSQGQIKLKAAKVLVVGAGGLGSPLSLYLAAAGVGTIGLVDSDVVESSNLQRQILYSTDCVGRAKLGAAKARLQGINPGVVVALHERKPSSDHAVALFKDYDVICDATDNFPSRYRINDACALAGRPEVHAAVFRFEGQLTVFDARRGPCYRCLYPQAPAPGAVPDASVTGLLGMIPGVLGTLQALEAIKLILGIGSPLLGRLLLFDGLAMEFDEIGLRKDPDCPLCGKNPTIKSLS